MAEGESKMKVLVVDDDPGVTQTVSLCLNIRWPQSKVMMAANGTDGISLAERQSLELVILDSDLPDMNGLEVCREIRRFSNVPIIMLGTTATDTSVSHALEAGADVYLIKPFRHMELLSRVQAVIRRAQNLPLLKREGIFSNGRLTIDFDRRAVHTDKEYITLTPIEYGLLYCLSQNVGTVQTYQALLSKVWGEEHKNDRELLRSHIRNLRRKLGDNLQNPKMIISEREAGYILVKSTSKKQAGFL